MTGNFHGVTDIAIRADIEAAHRRAWARLANPGTWLDGAERVAVARETRAAPGCARCREATAALSPNMAEGVHDRATDLSDAEVEAIHRIATDPGRLAEGWYRGLVAAGLDEGRYVEIVGAINTVFSVDVFCRALGIAPPDLPQPEPGAPSRHRPPEARRRGHWVATLDPDELGPAEADLYRASNAANIYRALSLVPDEVRGFRDLDDHLYLPADDIFDLAKDYRAIGRAQIELVAGRVSANNGCRY